MRAVYLVIAGLILGSVTAVPSHVGAMPGGPLHITTEHDGVHISWQGSASQAIAMDQDSELSTQLLALHVEGEATVVPQVKRLTSVPWSGAMQSNEATSFRTLPDAPVSVLREGRIRGVRVAVIQLSSIFSHNGVQQVATDLDVTIPDATVFDQDTASLLARSTPFLAAAPSPTNPAAAIASATLRVTQVGIQQVRGSALAATGLRLSDTSQLHLYHNGSEVALEVRDGGDKRLDATDEIRFYASAPGDRWNRGGVYWLTAESTPGLRMATRAATTRSAPLQETVYQSDTWRSNAHYDSLLPGPDGDHWFSADFTTGPGLPPASTLVTLTQTLPDADGTATLQIDGSAYTSHQHQLTISQHATQVVSTVYLPVVRAYRGSSQVARSQPQTTRPVQTASVARPAFWNGEGDWSQTFTLAAPVNTLEITLASTTVTDGVALDRIVWRHPVQLALNGKGAFFETEGGDWTYRIRNAAVDRTLYDISDERAPVIVTIPPGTTTTFYDGAQARRYALTGRDVLHTPEVAAHTPMDLTIPMNVDALYIAPTTFRSALAPLVALREAQGYAVGVVDVQAIYDAWSFGQVSPEAIRSFLRYAAATWSRAPRAVTLVGDGTTDPFGYSFDSNNPSNVNLIPPYVAMVDPWIGETACETCYALLDSDNPLDDMLPDLSVGRFPVKNVVELQAFVAKLLSYEQQPLDLSRRTRNVFIADNYREADGTPDEAGDFAASADKDSALQPSGVDIVRMYYDPARSHIGVAWREPDAAIAAQKTFDALNAGAEIVNFYGHGSPFQMAFTDTSSPGSTGSLFSLYDSDALTNSNRLAVFLQMTCLTGAFQTPAYSGTSIDERLVLNPNGGAAAVWSSTGRGVAYGHAFLQAGFYGALWRNSQIQIGVPLGTLTTAGYQNLFTKGRCCQESINTFSLLGDPLTMLRVRAQ